MIIKKDISREKDWLFGDGSQPFQLKIVQPGEVNPVTHYHKTMHEYFFLLQGTAVILVDGNNYELGKGDLLVVEPGETHKLADYSPDMELLLLMPPPAANDKVIV
jgi:mannose-6-phosphate isomerase-like protein (cupin superfamily)